MCRNFFVSARPMEMLRTHLAFQMSNKIRRVSDCLYSKSRRIYSRSRPLSIRRSRPWTFDSTVHDGTGSGLNTGANAAAVANETHSLFTWNRYKDKTWTCNPASSISCTTMPLHHRHRNKMADTFTCHSLDYWISSATRGWRSHHWWRTHLLCNYL